MLLYVFRDGTCRQVEDNPTTTDILGVVSGALSIFKGTDSGYYRLIVGKAKFSWQPIKEAKTFSCPDGRLHQ
jgi:hypothetical protein